MVLNRFAKDGVEDSPAVGNGSQAPGTVYTRSLEAWDLEDAPVRAQSPNVQHGLDFEPVC